MHKQTKHNQTNKRTGERTRTHTHTHTHTQTNAHTNKQTNKQHKQIYYFICARLRASRLRLVCESCVRRSKAAKSGARGDHTKGRGGRGPPGWRNLISRSCCSGLQSNEVYYLCDVCSLFSICMFSLNARSPAQSSGCAATKEATSSRRELEGSPPCGSPHALIYNIC